MEPRYQNFKLEVSQGVAVLIVDRPQVRNAMDQSCWEELRDFLGWAAAEEEVGVIILTGAGEKAFVAGADVRALLDRSGVEAWKDRSGVEAMERIENCPKPVIAAVNGSAFGGGCELALACDLRLAAENAKFAMPEIGLGIMPGLGGTQRLARLVGEGRAKEMILAGRVLTGAEAAAAGLVMKCVPQGRLMDEARTLARTLLSKGPLSLTMAKQAVSAALSTDRKTGVLVERLSYCLLLGSQDKAEGVTAFLEERDPRFRGE